jgi:formylglycine-generating enzyme required for sulfatase activity
MQSLRHLSFTCLLLLPCGCADRSLIDDASSGADDSTGETETFNPVETGDTGNTTTTSDGDGDGDGDGDPGDGDGDGDGDTGDGDGDNTGDGDGEPGGLVDLGDYMIRSTEVSITEYAEFLAANVDLSGLPETCAWKTDYVPNNWAGQSVDAPTLPVIGVDWCDAWAYCDWAGDRLCGLVGGQAAGLDDIDNAMTNEWYRACSADGSSVFPYGNDYAAGSCNGLDFGLAGRWQVGTVASCEGGAAGVFDMSGNVWEWTSACGQVLDILDSDQECRRRGGSYFSSATVLRCAVSSKRPRSDRDTSTGIRCCADPISP